MGADHNLSALGPREIEVVAQDAEQRAFGFRTRARRLDLAAIAEFTPRQRGDASSPRTLSQSARRWAQVESTGSEGARPTPCLPRS